MKKRLAWMVLAVVMMLSMTAQAVGGNGGGNGGGSGGGNGDGTGGGQNEALFVESASVENGAVLGAQDTITLVFSKNVVNSSVKETNLPLFAVTDGNGAAVEITVTMADDQIEPDKKNDVVIAPADSWADGSYTLTAQAGITSKSGDVMEKDYTLSFTVGASVDDTIAQEAPDAATTDTAADTAEDTAAESAETDTAEDADTAVDTADTAEDGTAAAEQEINADPFIIGVIVAVVVVAGLAVLLRKKK